RPRPRRSAGCSAPPCSGWPRSPTATGSAPPTSARWTCAPTGPGMTTARRDEQITLWSCSMTTAAHPELEGLDRYKFGWADSDEAGASARRGLNEDVVRDISGKKDEPEWMLDLRLKGLRLFSKKPMPTWGSD